jgi:hypothetical protein
MERTLSGGLESKAFVRFLNHRRHGFLEKTSSHPRMDRRSQQKVRLKAPKKVGLNFPPKVSKNT